MSVLKKNIAANFAGSLWTGLMSFIFVPLYISFLGIEAYGLVGIFATLVALFSLLDLGLSTTIKRELACLVVQSGKGQEMRDLLRTLEVLYWLIAVLIGVTLIVIAPLIVNYWVNVEKLSHHSVKHAIMLMGIGMIFQWPLILYSGGLQGLQRQVLLNSIDVGISTCRVLGSILILWLISPTVEAFFTWQMIVNAIHVISVAIFLWRSLPKTDNRPHFKKKLLQNIWRFAAFISGSTVLAAVTTQLDKVILSRMLSLEIFGYYSLANVVALNIYRLINPIASAVWPRLANLVSIGDKNQLIKLYHQASQLVAILILPAMSVIVFFSKELILLWTQNHLIAENTNILVTMLIIGATLNGITSIPYGLQIAFNWPKLTFFANLFSAVLFIPLIIIFIYLFGAVGAASVGIVLNGGYIIFAIPIMHKRILQEEKWRWYREDVGIPFFMSVAVAGIFRLLIPAQINMLFTLVWLTMISIITFGTTAFATPVSRNWICNKLSYLRNYHKPSDNDLKRVL